MLTFHNRSQLYGILVVIITWLIFFSPILSGQYMYFLDDLKIIYYPIEAVYAQFQHNWQLPVWSNAFGFGQPLMAWGQLGFFTPLHVLMRALFVPPLILLQASVVLYFLIGSLGMYVFLRQRLFHPASASLGAVVFAYCGFMIGHLNHVNFYTSTMLLPILLLAIHHLIKKPTLVRSAGLALIAGAITVSGQPQVVLYVFCIASIVGLGMYIPTIWKNVKQSGKVLALTMVAGGIGFCISSFAILPLQEFVPNTDRGAGLAYEELFEFSYPPYASITMVLPYFFGDHTNYNGPKGFQELAGYTGIIPLLLAGIGLTYWKTRKAERISGLVLVIAGIALVLGHYSPVYQYLVNNHYISTIGVVGRFIFFFDIGIILLAVAGLQDIIERTKESVLSKLLRITAGLALPIVLIGIPFVLYSGQNPDAYPRFFEILSWKQPTIWPLLSGIIIVPFAFFKKLYWALPVLTAYTLLVYGWSYNPILPTQQALSQSPVLEELAGFASNNNNVPARLFASEHLPVTGNPHVRHVLTDFISPQFSVFQPLKITREKLSCLTIPIQSDSPKDTHVDVMIRSGFDGAIWFKKRISSIDAYKITYQKICFPEIEHSSSENLMLSFTSDENTNMKLFSTPSINDESGAFFMRVQQPTPNQIQASKKQLSIEYAPEYPITSDMDNAILVRNIQAIAGVSSASWISALAIGPYRAFINTFFANDSDSPFNGDGIHTLTKYRNIVNMVGITHFTQSLEYNQTNDPMVTAGYKVVSTSDTGNSLIRLYFNPSAYPRAFMVPKAEFVPADDEIRARMLDDSFNPREIVYVSGPTPPDLTDDQPSTAMQATANIMNYTDTRVDVEVTSNKTAYLVLTDSTLPQWHTYIDDKPALPLKGNSAFKSAQVPAGTHIVSFRYNSPAINQSKILTIIGIIAILAIYGHWLVRRRLSFRA